MDYYDREADSFIADTVDVDMSPLYARFLPHIPKAGRILDAGCGSGRDSKFFLSRGFDVTAFDASKKMATYASALTGLNVHNIKFEDIAWGPEFDGIWACASLLHLPPLQFVPIIERLFLSLRQGGCCFSSFKLGAGNHRRDGRIFFNHTEISLSKALRPITTLERSEFWVTAEQRPGRTSEEWLNVLLFKTCSESDRGP